MSEYTVRVHADATEDDLRRLALFMADLRPFWPRASRLMTGWLRLQFESEGVFWHLRRWAPLSPSYAARKRILWGDRPILQASGQMRRAFSRPERRATPTMLSLVYDDAGPEHGAIAQFHQEGSPRMPARPIIGDELPPLARFELEREAVDYLADVIRRIF